MLNAKEEIEDLFQSVPSSLKQQAEDPSVTSSRIVGKANLQLQTQCRCALLEVRYAQHSLLCYDTDPFRSPKATPLPPRFSLHFQDESNCLRHIRIFVCLTSTGEGSRVARTSGTNIPVIFGAWTVSDVGSGASVVIRFHESVTIWTCLRPCGLAFRAYGPTLVRKRGFRGGFLAARHSVRCRYYNTHCIDLSGAVPLFHCG